MAFRGNNRNRNYGGSNYCGGPMGSNRMGGGNMNMSPWENQSVSSNFGMGNMRQGVSGGQGMNAQAINLANNLLNNLFRNQNPPSLLDLPRGGGMGNRNQRGGLMVNRAGPGNRLNNYGRRVQGGFQNRGGVTGSGAKPPQKQGASGIRKPNALDRVKKPSAKNATNKKKDSASGDKKNESKESPYATVSNDMFYCHLCKKHMWDANSFENHIKGRTHLMMREGIEESYRLKANMIRQEAKIAEQLKSIELDRLKRMGKSKQRQLDYCTMCDLNFHGNLSAHRKSEGHLQLKKFLHPKCNECNKEFATRIDYDSHLLSADHLKKAAEKNTKVGERKRNTLNIVTEEDELKDVRPPQKKRKKSLKRSDDDMKRDGDESVGTSTSTGIGSGGTIAAGDNEKSSSTGDGEKVDGNDGGGGGDDGGEKVIATATATSAAAAAEGNDEAGEEMKECGDDMTEMADDEELALPVDPDDCIVDYVDGDVIPTEIESRLPKYNWTRPVGAGFISKLVCYECSLCGKFLDVETTAEIHSRTVTHHRNFLKFINEKSGDTKIAQKRAAAALEESERKKRRVEEAEAAATAECDADVKLENACEDDCIEDADGGNEELYDPSEATADDEDVEMAENGDDGEVEGNDDGDWVITEENSNDVTGEMDAQNTEEMAEQPCHGMESTDEVFPSVKVEGGKTAEPLVVANAIIANATAPTKLMAATATAAPATAAASNSGQPAAAAAGIVGPGPVVVQATISTPSTPTPTPAPIITTTTATKPISTSVAATSLSPPSVATTIGGTAVAAAAPIPAPTPAPPTATATVASNVGALTASSAMIGGVTSVAAAVPPLIEAPSPTKRTMPNRAVRGSPRGRARGRHNLY